MFDVSPRFARPGGRPPGPSRPPGRRLRRGLAEVRSRVAGLLTRTAEDVAHRVAQYGVHRGLDRDREGVDTAGLLPGSVLDRHNLAARHDLEPVAPVGPGTVDRHVDEAAVVDGGEQGLVVRELTRGDIGR